MLNSLPIRIIRRSLSWLTRFAVIVSATLAVLAALAIILLRYWLLPDIERYHDMITASVTEAIGNTVTIGKIEGDWEGLQPRLSLTDVRILDDRRQPALMLSRVDSRISWMTLISAELRLDSLEINRPELLVRRDAQGKLYLGDLLLSSQGGDHNLADWLLHQSNMSVRDALIVWVDEQREAPPLVLQKVDLHIESMAEQHRFALRALPPEYLATPLDLRGDFHGASFDDMGKWHGQIYTRFNYTDVVAWRHWLDLPRELSRGRGALRAWLDVDAGRVAGVTADMDLYDVVAKLAEDAPELSFANLRGRAAWKTSEGGFEVSTQKLAIRLLNGAELQPMDLYFRTSKADNGQPANNELRVNLLQLEMIASLAGYLPLKPDQRAQLEAYSPRGRVSQLRVQWQGALEKSDKYSIKGHFEDIALRQAGAMPGFSGLSLDVDGSNTGGRLNVNSRQLVVDAPGVMREPLTFATLVGQAGWLRENNELRITLDSLAVANDDLAGNVYGSFQTKAGTLGVLDLTAGLTRGDIRQAARYTPLIALDREGNDWLKGAILAGHTEDLTIRIKGNLSDLSTGVDKKDALFEIGGHAQDAVLEFAKDWSRIENITGEFSIRGNKLEVKASSATMSGARLQNVVVSLPDMTSDDLALEINGEAEAGNDTFLQFIQQSPVRGYINKSTDGVRASGNGHLTLFTRIPLKGSKAAQVSGNFQMQKSDIDPGEGVPWLRNTSGVLVFTESGMQASGVMAEILGGTASIDMQAAGGAVHVAVKGRSDLDVLHKSEALPLLDYLHGSAEWDADISVKNKNAKTVIRSDLSGISSSLPQPFTKSAWKVMQLRVEKKDIADGQDLITVRLGSLLNARLERSEKKGTMFIKRGTVNFGGLDKLADTSKAKKSSSGAQRNKSGIWLAGSLPELSLQGWDGLMKGAAKPGQALPIAGADLRIGKLTGYGQTVKSLHIDAVKRGDGMSARLASNTLNGTMAWLPHGYKKDGKLSAHLRNLYWVKDEQHGQPSSPLAKPGVSGMPVKPGKTEMFLPGKLPALDIKIEDLQVKEKQFGRIELVGHPDGKDWRMRRLSITNPDGRLTGDGVWRFAQEATQTQVNLQLKLDDVGNTLARYGYPGTVKDGSGKLAANLSWAGAPDEFNYASLSGTLKLDAGKGRFLKMDPGAGKLLSILSLQALPSHITLDLNDVFRRGFQFDNISGNATINDGMIDTQDFHIDSSAAKVTMSGSVDLNSETQELHVRVFPTIGDSVSLISAFTAGPAVGVGALIVSKILGDPLDKLVSFEYNVSGTWREPNVVKVVQPPVQFE
jgi:uncharacterized protein (TIGR02099 family)